MVIKRFIKFYDALLLFYLPICLLFYAIMLFVNEEIFAGFCLLLDGSKQKFCQNISFLFQLSFYVDNEKLLSYSISWVICAGI